MNGNNIAKQRKERNTLLLPRSLLELCERVKLTRRKATLTKHSFSALTLPTASPRSLLKTKRSSPITSRAVAKAEGETAREPKFACAHESI